MKYKKSFIFKLPYNKYGYSLRAIYFNGRNGRHSVTIVTANPERSAELKTRLQDLAKHSPRDSHGRFIKARRTPEVGVWKKLIV